MTELEIAIKALREIANGLDVDQGRVFGTLSGNNCEDIAKAALEKIDKESSESRAALANREGGAE